MIEKLTKEKLLKILNEELESIIREDDPVETPTQTSTSDYSSLSSSLSDMASKMNPENKHQMDLEITNALRGGKTKIDYNAFGKDRIGFIYFTDALATIVKYEKPGAENAKKALMSVFSPYSQESSTHKDAKGERVLGRQKMSNFFAKVGRFAATHIDLKGNDAVYFVHDDNTDNMLDAWVQGFENAIEYFNPELKKSFNSLISTAIANVKIDIWRKQNQYQHKGEKVMKQTSSLDTPLDAEDSDAGTLGDTVPSHETSTDRMMEKNRARKVWRAIDEFIKRAINFNFPDNPKYEQVYDMYTNQDKDIEKIADALGVDNGNVRIMKMRAEDAVQPFITDGTLADFVFRTTGEKIDNIPFIKGKGSDKTRFVFPKVAPTMKESIDELDNILILNENCFTLDTTSFYDESHEPDWMEYTKLIVKEANYKLGKISKIYEQFNGISSLINETYDGNYNIDTMDLFDEIKGAVIESSRIIEALYAEAHKIENAAFNIHKEYPQVAETMANVINPIIKELELWPKKLNNMVTLVRTQYNPKNAFGL